MSRKKEQAPEGAPEWMTTYSDLVTLLLTFFILLFSMATVDKDRFSKIAESLSNSVVNLKSGDSILEKDGNSVLSLDFSSLKDSNEAQKEKEKYLEAAEEMVVKADQQIKDKKIDEAKNRIRDTINEKGISDKTQVIEEKDFLMIRLDSEVFFDSGSADIKTDGIKVLSAIAATLRGIENEIMISGHTDNVPMSNKQFKSNWELSTARATNAVKYLVEVEKLNPVQFTATGNGEYHPIGDNKTSQGRQMNRRIELKIIK